MRGRILWVDDEIDLLKPHLLYLQEKGYDVVEINNGQDAVSTLEQDEQFDLVLLDQIMPGMDGLTTLRMIKDIRPLLPVILITKSEEEWLMDEAISEKIADYLTKPVNPSQIFLACKKVLEGEKILDEKATSDYLKDFQEIETILSGGMSIEDWWILHQKLVDWQIEMDKRKDTGLGSVLNEQLKSCNHRFSQFVSENYLDWLHSDIENRPPISTDVLHKFVLPYLKNRERVFLLVVDCFRLDQVMTILPEIQRYFNVDIDFHLSLLPSATPFCRNAIFSGKHLGKIQKLYPKMWESMVKDEFSMNRFESDLLALALQSYGLGNLSVKYQKVSVAKEGRNLLNRITDYLDTSLMALVVNFLDLLAHYRSESEILQEMMPDEAGYRSIVKSWFVNSWLYEVLKVLSETDYKVILTSDHGSIRVQKGVQVAGDKKTSSGVRYKYGKNLNCSDRSALVIKQPGDYFLPEMVTGTNYLIAKEDVYLVFPTQYRKYIRLFQNSFQHGGISLDEMLVPTFILSGK